MADFFFKCRPIKQQINDLIEPCHVASYEREILRELGEFEPKCEAKELNWSQFFDLENRSHCFRWTVLQLSPEGLESDLEWDADTPGRAGILWIFVMINNNKNGWNKKSVQLLKSKSVNPRQRHKTGQNMHNTKTERCAQTKYTAKLKEEKHEGNQKKANAENAKAWQGEVGEDNRLITYKTETLQPYIMSKRVIDPSRSERVSITFSFACACGLHVYIRGKWQFS